ncbi:hypothetical protein BMW23_0919 [Bodo saltans virus]|uniref:Telomerase reverse transcriptase TEN domain-containing protein n=1 Tax=Bodo saltans virus TaxID=2024608 RepID=A0A2H4UVQ6_9VIRU|nr:hypothetical protein QJ851_gp0901 [Bodo saltans virus]ATZ80964.1 hypothetical protein BMW23_0919 [Bodo saltans virus]
MMNNYSIDEMKDIFNNPQFSKWNIMSVDHIIYLMTNKNKQIRIMSYGLLKAYTEWLKINFKCLEYDSANYLFTGEKPYDVNFFEKLFLEITDIDDTATNLKTFFELRDSFFKTKM